MDLLQLELARLVEEWTSREDDPQTTFSHVRRHVDTAFGPHMLAPGATTRKRPRRDRQRPPRLTESWFC